MNLEIHASVENSMLCVNFSCSLDRAKKLGDILAQEGISFLYPVSSVVSEGKTSISLTAYIHHCQKKLVLAIRSEDPYCDFLLDRVKKEFVYLNF